jgi:Protein of unknown function (DUF2946)
MHLRRSTQRFIASLALAVVAFAALVPALANAFGVNNMGPMAWIELCSAQGTKRIAVDSAGDPIVSGAPVDGADKSRQAAAHMGEHCPFCHIEHTPAALPPALPPTVPQTQAHQAFPALFYAAKRPMHAWAPALARAPPALS